VPTLLKNSISAGPHAALEAAQRIERIKAAMATRDYLSVSFLARRTGCDRVLASGQLVNRFDLDATFNRINLQPESRIELKRALERLGLLLN
jgi:hypothetical protein